MKLKSTDVIYQIFPASFKDTNDDGWGDLKGVTSKLDYLKDLGVDYVWLCPIYSTHFVDAGYDVDDYYNIFKNFGTINDAEEMIDEANKRGIGIVMDIVLNHTSNNHVWFKEACKSRDSKYYNYFMWSEKPLSNMSIFGGSSWEYNEPTDSYYYHLFSKEQPDLNWDNPELRKEIYKTIEFWIKRGVKGFRIDALEHVGKDILTDTVKFGPNIEPYLKELQKEVFDKHPDVVTMGESWSISKENFVRYTSGEHKFIESFFNFSSLGIGGHEKYGRYGVGSGTVHDVIKALVFWQTKNIDFRRLINFFTCHDVSRSLSRWTDESEEAAKFLGTLIFSLAGIPLIYQGEEIGMTNPRFTKFDQFRDVDFFNHHKIYVDGSDYTTEEFVAGATNNGRDASRTPMNWTSGKYGGFSNHHPWIDNSPTFRNVESQLDDKNSILNHFKKLIKLRKSNELWTTDAKIKIEIIDEKTFYITKYINSKTLCLKFSSEGYIVEQKKDDKWVRF